MAQARAQDTAEPHGPRSPTRPAARCSPRPASYAPSGLTLSCAAVPACPAAHLGAVQHPMPSRLASSGAACRWSQRSSGPSENPVTHAHTAPHGPTPVYHSRAHASSAPWISLRGGRATTGTRGTPWSPGPEQHGGCSKGLRLRHGWNGLSGGRDTPRRGPCAAWGRDGRHGTHGSSCGLRASSTPCRGAQGPRRRGLRWPVLPGRLLPPGP